MAKYIKEITVDVAGEMLFEYITAVQNDAGSRFVKITLLNNHQPFTAPSGTTAILRCKKPDRTSVFNDCVINADGTVEAELTKQMLAVAGNARCEITLYGSDESVLTSVSFIVKITPAAIDESDVQSTDEFLAIEKALAQVNRSEGVANAALETANTALNKMGQIEANIDAHTAAADAATTRANTAATNAEAAIAQIAGATVTKYGVKLGGSANTGATVTRLYNAFGLVAGVGTDTQTAVNDFDNIYPWAGRRRCCGFFNDKGDFIVNAYKGEPGYAADGSNGEVWVETPLFYYKHTYGADGSEEIVISAFPIGGYNPAPIFINADGSVKQKAYTAAYPMATVDGKATSRSGVFSDYGSLNSFMVAARTLGTNYTTTTTAEWYTKCLLMWVEFATRNLQNIMNGASSMPYVATDVATIAETNVNRIILATAKANAFVVGQAVGIGTSNGNETIAKNRVITSITDYDASNRAITFDGPPVNIAVGNCIWTTAYKNGSCDNVLTSSGSPVSNTDGKHNCVYRGEETPYGNAFEWISDVLFKREGAAGSYTFDIYYLPDPTKYTNGGITADYIKLNYQLPPGEGYATKLGFDSRYPHMRLPSVAGGSSTTYYSDYYYMPAYDVCAAGVGGYWSAGTKAGPCYWYCYYAPSHSNIYRRARLSYHRS